MEISESDRQIIVGALDSFGASIDYAQIVKEYSSPSREDQRKYSPAQLTAVFKTAIVGNPNPSKVCTSYIERANLTVRTHCKRLERLTLAFSKKFDISKRRLLCTSRIITSLKRTAPFVALPQWKPGLKIARGGCLI
jgi:hypothetical protein